MESWNLNEMEVEPHQPQVLDSESEGRAIVINLPKGEQLQEHQVHERAWLLVIDGNVELNTPDGKWAAGGPGPAGDLRPEGAPRGAGGRGLPAPAGALPLARGRAPLPAANSGE